LVRVEVWSEDQRILRFQVTGHAGYAEYGQDIVCAGVSVLVETTLHAFDKLVKHPHSKKVKSGNVYFELQPTGDMALAEKAQLLLQTMVLGLREMEESYGKYVTLIEYTGRQA
jgi:uncharacterized protein YsxB (DUF464 family)